VVVVVVVVVIGGDWWCDGLIFPPQNWRLMSMSLSRAQMQVSRSGGQNRPTATDTAAKWHSLSRAACHRPEWSPSLFPPPREICSPSAVAGESVPRKKERVTEREG
jgi:hypothetical protein